MIGYSITVFDLFVKQVRKINTTDTSNEIDTDGLADVQYAVELNKAGVTLNFYCGRLKTYCIIWSAYCLTIYIFNNCNK